jgi:hypothetical protein
MHDVPAPNLPSNKAMRSFLLYLGLVFESGTIQLFRNPKKGVLHVASADKNGLRIGKMRRLLVACHMHVRAHPALD